MASLGTASIELRLDDSQFEIALGRVPSRLQTAGRTAEAVGQTAFTQAGRASGTAFDSAIQQAATNAGNAFRQGLSTLNGVAQPIGQNIRDGLLTPLQGVGNQAAASVRSGFAQGVADVGLNAGNQISTGLLGRIAGSVVQIGSTLAAGTAAITTSVSSVGNRIGSSIQSGIITPLNSLGAQISASIVTTSATVVSTATNLGVRIGDGVRGSIVIPLRSVGEGIRSALVVGGTIAIVEAAYLGGRIGGRLYASIPEPLRQLGVTIANTISNATSAVLSAANNLGGQAGTGINNNTLSPLQRLGTGIGQALSSATGSVVGIAANLGGGIGGSIHRGILAPLQNIGRDIGNHLRNTTSSIGQGIGMAIGQNITNAIGGAVQGAASMKNIGNYDAGVRQIRSLGANSSEFEESAKSVTKALGNNVDVITALNSLYDVASSGFTKAADAQNILTASVKLATTSNSELEDVQRTILGTMNAYGLGADKAADVSNKMFGAINAGVLNGKELASTFGNVSGAAAAAGVSLDETLALLAVTTLKGIKAPEAVTGVRALIEQFSNISKEGQKALIDLGVRADSTALKQKGVYAILKEIEAKGATAEQTAAIFTSSEARKIVNSVKGKDGGNKFEASRKTINSTSIDKSYEDVSAGINQQKKAFENKIINLDVKFKSGFAGEAFINALSIVNKGIDGIVSGIEKLNAAYQALSPGQKQITNQIGGIATVVTGAAAGIVGITAAFTFMAGVITPTITLIGGAAAAFGSLALASAPIAIPLLAVAAAVYGIAKALGATDTTAFVAGLTAVGAGLALLFGPAVIGAIGTGIAVVVTGFGSIAAAAAASLIPLAPYIAAIALVAAGLWLLHEAYKASKPAIDSWANGIAKGFGSAADSIKNWWSDTTTAISKWWGSLGEALNNAGSGLSKWVSNTGAGLRQWADSVGNAISNGINYFGGLTSAVGFVFNAVMRVIAKWALGALAPFIEFAAATVNILMNWGSSLGSSVRSFTSDTSRTITNWTSVVSKSFTDLSQLVISTVVSWTQKALTTIAKWVESTVNLIGGFVTGTIKLFGDWISGVTGSVVKFVSQSGVIQSTTKAAGGIFDWFKNTAASAFKFTENAIQNFGKACSGIFDGVITKVKELIGWFGDLPNKIGGMTKSLTGMIPGMSTTATIATNSGSTSLNGKSFKVASPIAGTTIEQAINYRGLPVQRPEAEREAGAHNAIDYGSGIGATLGTPVQSVIAGKATYTPGVSYYKGKYSTNQVMLEGQDAQGNKIKVLYFHLGQKSADYFKNGFERQVKAGEAIGVIGSDGKIGGNEYHLDIKTWVNGQRVKDPRQMLANLNEQAKKSAFIGPQPRQQAAIPKSNSGGTNVTASVYYPGGGGMEGREIDARSKRLTRNDMVVAIPGQNLIKDQIPYGSKLEISYQGKKVLAEARDAGPYVPGRQLDMTEAVAKAIGFNGLGTVSVKLVELPKGADPNKDYRFGDVSRNPNFKGKNDAQVEEEIKQVVVPGNKSVRLDSRRAAETETFKNYASLSDPGVEVASTNLSGLGIGGLLANRIDKQITQAETKLTEIQNYIKKLEAIGVNSPSDKVRYDKAKQQESNAVSRITELKNRRESAEVKSSDAVKKSDIDSIQNQINLINSQSKTRLGEIDRQRAEGKITTDSDRDKLKNQETVATASSLTKLTSQVKELRRKYSGDSGVEISTNSMLDTINSSVVESRTVSKQDKKKNSIDVIKSQIGLLISNASTKATEIDRQVASDKITEQQGENLKANELKKLSIALDVFIPAIKKAQKTATPEARVELNSIMDTINQSRVKFGDVSDKKTELSRKNDVSGLQKSVSQINQKSDNRILNIDEQVANKRITEAKGETLKTEEMGKKSKLLDMVLPKAEVVRSKYKDDEGTYSEISTLIQSIHRSRIESIDALNKNTQESRKRDIESIKSNLDKITQNTSVEITKIERQVAEGSISESKGAIEIDKLESKKSASYDKIRSKVTQYLKKYADEESQSSLKAMEETIDNQGKVAATSKSQISKLPIDDIGKTVKAKTAKVTSQNEETDLQVATSGSGVSPFQGELIKAKRMQSLRAELAQTQTQVSALMDTFKDNESLSKLESISSEIKQQAMETERITKSLKDQMLGEKKTQVQTVLNKSKKDEDVVAKKQSLGKISDVESAAQMLDIKLKTAKTVELMIAQFEQLRAVETDPAVIESINEQIAAMQQVTHEAKLAELAQHQATLAYGVTKSVSQAVVDATRDQFTNLLSQGLNLGQMFDNLLGKIANIAMSKIFDEVIDVGISSVFGFKDGGEVPGYAAGGKVGGDPQVLNFARGGKVPSLKAIDNALKKEGANSILAALTPGEQVLTTKEAPIYRAAVRDGVWEKLKNVYNYAQGGVVANASAVMSPRSAASNSYNDSPSGRTVNLTIDKINEVNYVSLEQVEAMFQIQIPLAAKAGAAITEQNLSKTNWRNQFGL